MCVHVWACVLTNQQGTTTCSLLTLCNLQDMVLHCGYLPKVSPKLSAGEKMPENKQMSSPVANDVVLDAFCVDFPQRPPSLVLVSRALCSSGVSLEPVLLSTARMTVTSEFIGQSVCRRALSSSFCTRVRAERRGK